MKRRGASAKGRKARRSRGALTLLAFLFLASGLVRGLAPGGSVMREDWSGLPLAWASEASSETSATETPQTRPPQEVLDALAARADALDRRELALQERAQSLDIAEREIATALEDLVRAEEALRATIALADGAAADDLDRLTRMYASMKPKDAAALFEEMDPYFAAGFLGQMNPTAAANIMAGLSPPVAYTVSLVLAGRNVQVPTE